MNTGSSKRRNLTEAEIDRAVGKIRQMYDDYIITFLKSFATKEAFEDRYLLARRQRIDLTRFVHDEIELIASLGKEERKRIAPGAERRAPRRRSVGEYADRLIEQFREQIAGYPDLFIGEKASYETRKLFGALDLFEREHWPAFERSLRRVYPSSYSSPRLTLEPRMQYLTSGPGRQPPGLSRYQALLLRLPRSKSEVDLEERRLLLEAAFLLHGIAETLTRLLPEVTDGEERAALERCGNYVHTLISDFRLKDLRPSNQGV